MNKHLRHKTDTNKYNKTILKGNKTEIINQQDGEFYAVYIFIHAFVDNRAPHKILKIKQTKITAIWMSKYGGNIRVGKCTPCMCFKQLVKKFERRGSVIGQTGTRNYGTCVCHAGKSGLRRGRWGTTIDIC